MGEGTEDTRRVATREEIGNHNWDLVIDLAGSEARLVVTGRNDKSGKETVEVVHEALIREWARLRQWVDENRERLIQKRKIEAAAVEWRDKGKSKDDLLLGKQLNEAKVFQKEQNISLALSDLAGQFVVKSIRYRQSNRLKLVGFGFIPIVALTVFLGFTAERQMQISRHWSNVETAKGAIHSPARILALQELVKLGVPLNNIPLENANLKGVNLEGANLQHANLQSANLQSANLEGANLEGANLEVANLQGANLQSANLQGAYLEDAHLAGAHLAGASLSGAKLGCVKIYVIRCTNLSNTKNLTPEQVKQANNWEQPTYDPEFRKKLGLPNSK